ncbi:hypothetical protein [Paludisphaera mucosa]|uniref:Uncharacterized protein n=1 Tax=Paludisphaera mucosa TaxID=3030827 RepID=A0ABT6FIT1_9BACT|nr:hypothetical protein [Paludisphaera mucosa]MDG3007457.1 hypothetical protein [Paludisphaera mucosa]
MVVSITTLKLICELASVWMVGMVAILAFVVVTVDRLNVRIAELEDRIKVLGGETRTPASAQVVRRDAVAARYDADPRADRPAPVLVRA